MRGRLGDVATAAESLFLERGVAHGALSLVPVSAGETRHVHDHGDHAHPHRHIHVQSSFLPEKSSG